MLYIILHGFWEEWAVLIIKLCSSSCLFVITYWIYAVTLSRLYYNTLFLFVKTSIFIMKQKEQSVNTLLLICIHYIDCGNVLNKTRCVYRWHRTAFRSACRYGAVSYRRLLLWRMQGLSSLWANRTRTAGSDHFYRLSCRSGEEVWTLSTLIPYISWSCIGT